MAKGKKLLFVLLLSMALTAGYFLIWYTIPDEIHISSEEKEIPPLNLPLIRQQTEPAGLQGKSNIPKGELRIRCSLLGLIPVKEIQVHQVQAQEVAVSGQPIGIYMRTQGILVVGTGVVTAANGLDYEPACNIVQSGDYIVGINGKEILKKEELIRQICKSDGEEILLDVCRHGEEIQLKVSPVRTGQEEYKLGIWVRDDTQGIGTLTYLDKQGHFGALGHGISDVDTGELLSLSGGTLYDAGILSITRGVRGAPGELSGIIHYSEQEKLGSIHENTEQGIFGEADQRLKERTGTRRTAVAFKQEIQEGQAVICCGIDGQIKEYQVMIEKVYLNSHDSNKSMVIRVTDPELLAKTGGIVQGMSGSPILQNGKLIGAVTHVFVNDPTKGYGIFIETMLKNFA